ncbi:DNA-binding response regulator, partial [Pseudomonas sp. FW305-130]
MSSESPVILIVEDDADVAKAARLLLERQGMAVSIAADPAAA